MSNTDLRAAFDIESAKLLIICQKIIGLPEDLMKLNENWLKFRYKFKDRVPYFSSLIGTPFNLILQMWQLYSVLDPCHHFGH